MNRQRIALPFMLACLTLAGCGGSTLGAAATHTSTRTPLPTVTPSPATPQSTPTSSSVSPAITSDCVNALSGDSSARRQGDFLIVIGLGLDYPQRQLSDNLPLKPYQFTTQPPADPFVNPDLTHPTTGLDVGVCNASSGASHTLTGIAITIQSATPYTGQLNAWQPCSPIYTRQNGPQGGGCGGGSELTNCMLAAFSPGAAAGASATLEPHASNDPSNICPAQALPVTLKADDQYYAQINITMPTAAATYALAVTYTFDSASPATVSFADPILIAPVAHDWDGQACTTPSMQSQIPTSNPTTPYVCPKS